MFLLKGLVHFQIKMSWSFTHPHVIQDVYVFLSSVEKKLRFLMKTFQNLYPYSELQWTVEGQNYSFSVTGRWEKSLCKQRSGSNCRWNALLRNKKGQQGKKRTVSRHCLCALCVDSVGSRTLWAPGLCGLADSVGSRNGGALERATWPFQRNYITWSAHRKTEQGEHLCL